MPGERAGGAVAAGRGQVNNRGFQRRDFIIDTGSNGCLSIDTKLAEILIRSGHVIEREHTVKADATGFCVDRKLIVKEITLLGVRFENVPASVAEMNLIGMPLLMRFDLALDFPKQRYFLGDTSKVDTIPYLPDASGLGLTFLSASSLEVRHVAPDSAAEAATTMVYSRAPLASSARTTFLIDEAF